MTLHPKIFDAQLPSTVRWVSPYQLTLCAIGRLEARLRTEYFEKRS